MHSRSTALMLTGLILIQMGCSAGLRVGGDRGLNTGASVGVPPPVILSSPPESAPTAPPLPDYPSAEPR